MIDLNSAEATLSTDEAADLLGCSPDTLYAMVRAGEGLVEPLRLGRVLRWPTAKVCAVLGIEWPRPNVPTIIQRPIYIWVAR